MRLHIHCRLRSTGFTLVELLITITILAILTAVALPSLSRMIHRNRIIGTANEIVAISRFAQNEAIIRKQRVILMIDEGNPHHWTVYVSPNQVSEESKTKPLPLPGSIVEELREFWLDDRLKLIPDKDKFGKYNKIQFLPSGSIGGVTGTSERVVSGRGDHGSGTANANGALAVCSESFPQETINVYFGGRNMINGRKTETLSLSKIKPENELKQMTECEVPQR